MAKKIIALDAGHGMGTLGKRCLRSIDPAQTREWYLNDRIADRVQELLGAYDCSVLRVDDTTGDKDISLGNRVRAANNAGADIYISVHHNAGINGGSGGGTVVYYYNDSEMRAKAQRLYDAVVGSTGLAGNRSSRVAVGNLYVIRYTRMPALLLENGFMDSTKDTPIILTEAHAEKTAQGIVGFLAAELPLRKKDAGQQAGKPSGGQNGSSLPGRKEVYYPAYAGKKTTLAPALASIGVNSSYAFRAKIAKANGISGYIGTAAQNTHMYNLLVAGLLKKV
ncbi:N-acetylmuramoyl-L-alanine amidase [bacterium D16-50]|nr:N-acetylmuramoyl-L-alanine amidase [bacterium D16-50]